MGAPRLDEIRSRLAAGVGDGSCTWMPDRVRSTDVQALLTIAERAEALLDALQVAFFHEDRGDMRWGHIPYEQATARLDATYAALGDALGSGE